MNAGQLRTRTKEFTLRVLKVVAALPDYAQGRVVAYQLMKSCGSVGANYRAVCRARSRKDFINKLGVVIEEADESTFWLEVVGEGRYSNPNSSHRCCEKRTNSSRSFRLPAPPRGGKRGNKRSYKSSFGNTYASLRPASDSSTRSGADAGFRSVFTVTQNVCSSWCAPETAACDT